jgi:hypothetical protein
VLFGSKYLGFYSKNDRSNVVWSSSFSSESFCTFARSKATGIPTCPFRRSPWRFHAVHGADDATRRAYLERAYSLGKKLRGLISKHETRAIGKQKIRTIRNTRSPSLARFAKVSKYCRGQEGDVFKYLGISFRTRRNTARRSSSVP